MIIVISNTILVLIIMRNKKEQPNPVSQKQRNSEVRNRLRLYESLFILPTLSVSILISHPAMVVATKHHFHFLCTMIMLLQPLQRTMLFFFLLFLLSYGILKDHVLFFSTVPSKNSSPLEHSSLEFFYFRCCYYKLNCCNFSFPLFVSSNQ